MCFLMPFVQQHGLKYACKRACELLIDSHLLPLQLLWDKRGFI